MKHQRLVPTCYHVTIVPHICVAFIACINDNPWAAYIGYILMHTSPSSTSCAPVCLHSIGRKEIESPSLDSVPDDDNGRELASSVGEPPKSVRIPADGKDGAEAAADAAANVDKDVEEELFDEEPSGGSGSVTAVGVFGVLQVGLSVQELLGPSYGGRF